MTNLENELWAALAVLLDSVDYTSGACGPTEMVAACLPTLVIDKAKKAKQAYLDKEADEGVAR